MLVLSRKVGEQIMIGDDIVMTIVDLQSGGKVRVGIEAPKEVPIHRSEVYRAIKESQGRGVQGCDVYPEGP